jgi:hypothetical protein
MPPPIGSTAPVRNGGADEALEAILEHDVAVCPTLVLYTAFAERGLEFGIPPEVVTTTGART